MAATPAVVEAAVAHVEAGFAAFALQRNGKKPITDHGFKNATTNPDWIRTQLQGPRAGNYGIVWPTTSTPPVLAFDLDNGADGHERPWQDRLLELMDRYGRLPRTKSTQTPSGGRHAFFRWPADLPIPPGDELFGFTVRWPGRGYLVGPESSIDGVRYVSGPDTEIAELPRAWVDAAVALNPPRYERSGDALITITGGYQLPDHVPSGRRYATVRDYVASRYNAGLGEAELWELVRSQVAPRFNVPKTEAELRKDFERGLAKIAERLGPPAALGRQEAGVEAVGPIAWQRLNDYATEAVEWLWHRYLPMGAVTLFDGNPGEGKSTIVADLVARVTTGRTWPDDTPIGRPGLVLYITKEDDPRTQLRPRIEVADGDPSRVIFVGSDLLFPRDAGKFIDVLDQVQPRLVVIDPLMSYLEGKVRTISDNDIRSAIMTPLAEAARAVGCAVLIVRHFSKTAGQSALLRGAGSLGGLAGSARTVLALAPDPDDDDGRTRVFGVVKSNLEARPPSMRVAIEAAPVIGFQMTVSRARWLGVAEAEVSDLMERTREEHDAVREAEDALEELLSHGPLQSKDVLAQMKAKGHSKQATYDARRALHVLVNRVGFPAKSTWALFATDDEDSSPGSGKAGKPEESSKNGQIAGQAPYRNTEEINGKQGDGGNQQSFQSSGRPGHGVRARAHVRDEAEAAAGPAEPGTWLRPCRDFRAHQSAHRQTAAGWACEVCDPPTPEALP